MSFKKKVVFICRIKKKFVFICHLILNEIYIFKRNFLSEDMATTYPGNKYVMLVWLCVNSHFTGKSNWDHVEFGHILS